MSQRNFQLAGVPGAKRTPHDIDFRKAERRSGRHLTFSYQAAPLSRGEPASVPGAEEYATYHTCVEE